MKRRIYFAHPLRGDVEGNKKLISTIIRKSMIFYPDIVPLSPIHNFAFLDPEKYDPKKGMELCFELLKLADELWVFGDYKKSEGCRMEIDFAIKNNIPVSIVG